MLISLPYCTFVYSYRILPNFLKYNQVDASTSVCLFYHNLIHPSIIIVVMYHQNLLHADFGIAILRNTIIPSASARIHRRIRKYFRLIIITRHTARLSEAEKPVQTILIFVGPLHPFQSSSTGPRWWKYYIIARQPISRSCYLLTIRFL